MTYDEMRIRQAWPYDVKIAHARKVAAEFIDKVYAGIRYGGERGEKYEAHNVHISVGGLDSITLLLFLRKNFPDVNIPAISRSPWRIRAFSRFTSSWACRISPVRKPKPASSGIMDFR